MRIPKSMARRIVIAAALACFGLTFSKEAALLVAQTGNGTAAPGTTNTKATSPSATATAEAAKSRAFVDKYCVSCHNQRTSLPAEAPVRLDAADFDDLLGHAETWERVLR